MLNSLTSLLFQCFVTVLAVHVLFCFGMMAAERGVNEGVLTAVVCTVLCSGYMYFLDVEPYMVRMMLYYVIGCCARGLFVCYLMDNVYVYK